MHTKITKETTFAQLQAQLQEYELVLSSVRRDQDGCFVRLSENNGQVIAAGLGATLEDAIEDAFQDVDGLAVVGTVQGGVAA